ncbi:hypothetical protein B4Q13_19545, partial [Lacticaseibacillus rhamnosus]
MFQALERRHEQKGDRTGVTSGFRDIDDYTAGWQPGNLIIVAARPAMGKTSLALNMAVAAAKDEKKPIAVFSLEMTKQELVERLLSSEAKLDASKLRRGGRILGGALSWDQPQQLAVADSCDRFRRTAVPSGHGVGKTYFAARFALRQLFAFGPSSTVITTAPTWIQVEKLLWKELRSAFKTSLYPLGGNLLKSFQFLNAAGGGGHPCVSNHAVSVA